MPKAFEKCAKAKGSRIRTVTKGPHKGKLICFRKSGKAALGKKRGKG